MVIARFAGRDGRRIVADVAGAADAPPVLLLHGGGQTRHAWSRAADRLAGAGWRTIALDARGHGDSEWDPDGDYSLTAFADDLAAVVAAIDGPPPVLIGASLGGLTSLFLEGERAPGTARAIALVDVAPRLEATGTRRIHTFMDRPEGFASLEDAAGAIAAYNSHRPPPTDLRGLEKNLRQGQDGRWRWHWDPRFIGGNGPSELSDHARMEACARALTVPTLLVRGQLSDVLSEDGARELLALVPGARYVDVQGAGHMVAGDRNDVFAGALLDFLSSLGDRRANSCIARVAGETDRVEGGRS